MEMLFDTDLLTQRRRRALARPVAGADFLLRRVAEELSDRLGAVERQFDVGVEWQGATGLVGEACLATGRIGRLLRQDAAGALAGSSVRAAGFEDVPIEAGSVNLVLAPLALHLVNDLPGALVRFRRALKPDGLFLAAIPGAGTLSELRDVLLEADDAMIGGASPRVAPFGEIRAIGGLLQRAGFTLPVVDAETYVVRYDSLFGLMADLRAFGQTNPLLGRSRRPLGRSYFLRAAEIYQDRFSDPDGRIRATFSIVYASGWSPHESQQKPLRPGSAKARLADALRVPGQGPDTAGG